MKGSNFHHQVILGQALKPQTLNGATVNGGAITEPWRKAKQIAFIVNGGDFATNFDLRLKIQGLRRSDGTTWETLKEADGVTDLEFTATKYDNGGAGEAAAILGTMPLNDTDGKTYKALRIQSVEAGSANGIVGISYLLFELRKKPSGQVDDLFAKVSAAAD